MYGNDRLASGMSDHTTSAQSRLPNKPDDTTGSIKTASIADSAYQSMVDSSASSSSTGRAPAVTTHMPAPKPLNGTDLYLFKKTAAHNNQFRHFDNIKLALEARLQSEVLHFGYQPWHSMALHAKVLGRDQLNATVHIVVLCPQFLEDLLHRVLALEEIRVLLTLPHTAMTLPHLVISKPPCLTSMTLDFDVCCQPGYTSMNNTHCGAQLVLTDRSEASQRRILRRGTFGGVVKVCYGQGNIQYYGVTAGHVVNSVSGGRTQESTHTLRDTSILTKWVSSDTIVGQPLDPQTLPGVTANRASLAYDWGLFEIAQPYSNRAVHPKRNEPSQHSHLVLTAEKPHFQDGETNPVLVLGSEGGSRQGEISSIPARIWLAYSSTFVDAYVLDTGDQAVLEGDSGSWVVHAAAAELYGHVVATNIFGEAYIMPAVAALENMRECLGATSVTLPSTKDLPLTSKVSDLGLSKHASKTSFPRQGRKRGASVQQKLVAKALDSSRKMKKWSLQFTKKRVLRDRPYLETLHPSSLSSDVVYALLTGDGYNWEPQIMQTFFTEAEESHESVSSRMYLDDKHRCEDDKPAEWLSPQDIRSLLGEAHRAATQSNDPYHKRLIFVPRLNFECASALAEGATCSEAESLRKAIRVFAMSQIRFRAFTNLTGFPCFRLEFNLPYFAFSPSVYPSDGVFSMKTSPSLPRLDILAASLREHFLLVTISGFNNFSWHGYAFGAVCNNADDVYKGGEAEDTWDDDYDHTGCEDWFATAGCPGEVFEAQIWDPRIYFLRTVQIRLNFIHRANQSVIHILESSWKAWMNDHLGVGDAPSQLRTIRMTSRLFSQLKDRLHINDVGARNSLKAIEESFEELSTMEASLMTMTKQLEATLQILHLQTMSKQSELEQKNQFLTRIDTLASQQASAAAAVQAEERSRTTRVNVQLLMVTTSFVIALQYFTSERALFPFERSPRAFWISILILVPSLLLLSLTLYALDRFKEIFAARVSGKLAAVIAPPAYNCSSRYDEKSGNPV